MSYSTVDLLCTGRDVVVMGLTELMNARYVTHPAPCIHRYHKLLSKGSLLRRAFYILSLYAGSAYAKSQLNKPIVINGYAILNIKNEIAFNSSLEILHAYNQIKLRDMFRCQ